MAPLTNSPTKGKAARGIHYIFKQASQSKLAQQVLLNQLARDKATEEAVYMAAKGKKRTTTPKAQEDQAMEEEASMVLRGGKRKTFQGKTESELREKKRQRAVKVRATTKSEIEKAKLDGDIVPVVQASPAKPKEDSVSAQVARVNLTETTTTTMKKKESFQKKPPEQPVTTKREVSEICPDCSKRPWRLLWKGPGAFKRFCGYQACDHRFENLMDEVHKLDLS